MKIYQGAPPSADTDIHMGTMRVYFHNKAWAADGNRGVFKATLRGRSTALLVTGGSLCHNDACRGVIIVEDVAFGGSNAKAMRLKPHKELQHRR